MDLTSKIIWLQSRSLWHFLWIAILLSEVFTLIMNSINSLIWYGYISTDLLYIGMVDAFMVALIVGSFIIYIFRKFMEREKESLEEKDTLLREIHHRVKNNIAIVSALLHLQANRSEHNEEARQALIESRNRIKSMALVHEKLYQSTNLTAIKLNEYIRSLVENLFDSYAVDRNAVSFTTSVSDVPLKIDQLIPCGLIINELVTNSIKYAFPERQGKLHIDVKKPKPDLIGMVVSDNGPGIPEPLKIQKRETLGFKLVNSLVRQLDGEIEVLNERGLVVKICFPL